MEPPKAGTGLCAGVSHSFCHFVEKKKGKKKLDQDQAAITAREVQLKTTVSYDEVRGITTGRFRRFVFVKDSLNATAGAQKLPVLATQTHVDSGLSAQ